MKNTVQISFDLPRDEYSCLIMLCAEKGVSLKNFASDLLIQAIDDYEDQNLAREARKRLKEMDPKENISFEDAYSDASHFS